MRAYCGMSAAPTPGDWWLTILPVVVMNGIPSLASLFELWLPSEGHYQHEIAFV